jgi:hypothetical protein
VIRHDRPRRNRTALCRAGVTENFLALYYPADGVWPTHMVETPVMAYPAQTWKQ